MSPILLQFPKLQCVNKCYYNSSTTNLMKIHPSILNTFYRYLWTEVSIRSAGMWTHLPFIIVLFPQNKLCAIRIKLRYTLSQAFWNKAIIWLNNRSYLDLRAKNKVPPKQNVNRIISHNISIVSMLRTTFLFHQCWSYIQQISWLRLSIKRHD
jgi:hypothetical protein